MRRKREGHAICEQPPGRRWGGDNVRELFGSPETKQFPVSESKRKKNGKRENYAFMGPTLKKKKRKGGRLQTETAHWLFFS